MKKIVSLMSIFIIGAMAAILLAQLNSNKEDTEQKFIAYGNQVLHQTFSPENANMKSMIEVEWESFIKQCGLEGSLMSTDTLYQEFLKLWEKTEYQILGCQRLDTEVYQLVVRITPVDGLRNAREKYQEYHADFNERNHWEAFRDNTDEEYQLLYQEGLMEVLVEVLQYSEYLAVIDYQVTLFKNLQGEYEFSAIDLNKMKDMLVPIS